MPTIRVTFLLQALCMLCACPTWAQAASTNGFVENGLAYIGSPLQWEENDWISIGALFAVTGVAYQYDEGIRAYFLRHPSKAGARVTQYGEAWSEARVPTLMMAGMAGYGWWSEKPLWSTAAMNMLQAGLFSQMTVEVVKKTLQRRRPSKTGDHTLWFQTYKDRSMPSGHAAASFAFASALAHSLPEQNLIAETTLYAVALTGAWGRLYKNRHWLSDVMVAGYIGYEAGRFVAVRNKSTQSNVEWLPMYDATQGLSIALSLRF